MDKQRSAHHIRHNDNQQQQQPSQHPSQQNHQVHRNPIRQLSSLIVLVLMLTPGTSAWLQDNDLTSASQQSKKCQQYGHSCLGGHGKRSSPPSSPIVPENHHQQQQQQLIQLLSQLNNNNPQRNRIGSVVVPKPLSIPLYVYRNNLKDNTGIGSGIGEQQQQLSTGTEQQQHTPTMPNAVDELDDSFRSLIRFQKGIADDEFYSSSSSQRILALERMLANMIQQQQQQPSVTNQNDDSNRQSTANKPGSAHMVASGPWKHLS